MPEVSVVIPSYNHAKYIGETIESVLSQSFQDFEIVITDDGSRDNSIDIIRSFKDKRIRLYSFKENQGACLAANNCIKRSNGKYVAMLSSDDIFKPDKLKKQVDFLNARREFAAVFAYPEFINENDKILNNKVITSFNKKVFHQENRKGRQWLNYFINNDNCLCHPTMLIRREVYDKIGLYDPRLAGLPDYDFWVRLFINKYEIYILPEELIYFRMRDNEANASGDSIANRIRNAFEYTVLLENYFEIRDRIVLLEVFPELKEEVSTIKKLTPELMRYYVCKSFLNNSGPLKQLYALVALQSLYDLMKNNTISKMISKETGFTFTELNQITKQVDIFNKDTSFSSKMYRIKKEINKVINMLSR